MSRIVIAVDGPSGSGKSSTARGVAGKLGLRYLDTGAMYRAAAWWMLNAGVDVHDAEAVAAHATEPELSSGTDPDHPTIAVDGQDVSGPIRSREVTNAVSAVAAVPAIRKQMVKLQRELIGEGGIVVEGRDIGTVVLPNADLKIFLTADPGERARRRSAEGLAGVQVEVQQTLQEMARRDQRDSQRESSPLKQADDAIAVDTTVMSLDQVVDHIAGLAAERGA
ncbi:(d)CMP kinase [Flindersiella endophytica]